MFGEWAGARRRGRATLVILGSLLIAFTASAGYVALRLKPGIMPDEAYHLRVSQLYSATWGLPKDSQQSLDLGPLRRSPSLFYWLNGRILNLLGSIAPGLRDLPQLTILRLLGVAYSALGVTFVFLFARELLGDGLGPLLVTFLLTATLMFVFLGGGHSYDNLANACCFAAIFFSTRVWAGKPFLENTLAWLLAALVGSLVKITVLPLAALTGALWLAYVWPRRRTLDFRIRGDPLYIGACLLIVVLLLGNAVAHGGNLLKYGTLIPQCVQLWSTDQCMEDPQFVRDSTLSLRTKLTLRDALSQGYPDPIQYGLDIWSVLILRSVYGILAHQNYFPTLSISIHRILILWTVMVTVWTWRRPSYALGAAYIVFLAYALLVFQDNYNTELAFGFKHVGIQGRYLFPVIGIYYTLMIHAFLKIPHNLARKLTLAGTVVLFLLGGPLVTLYRGLGTVFLGWLQ
jgi:hypothetical protein